MGRNDKEDIAVADIIAAFIESYNTCLSMTKMYLDKAMI